MEEYKRRLSDMRVGESSVICELCCEGRLRHRLIDLGFFPGASVGCVGVSPLGDPKAYSVRSAVIAVRGRDGKNIIIE